MLLLTIICYKSCFISLEDTIEKIYMKEGKTYEYRIKK